MLQLVSGGVTVDEFTATSAVELMLSEEAVIVIGPPAAIAVNKSLSSIVPTEVSELVQVKVGWVSRTSPFWSSAMAVNC